MLSALGWWVVLEVLGLLSLPYLLFAFRRLPDQGLAFAKIAGVLLLGYLLWVIGTLRVAPNGRGAAALALVLIAIGALLLFSRQRARWRGFRRRLLPTLMLYEAVFLLGFLFWALVRAYNPEIDGTEKPMDFALLNTAIRSVSFPPADPWLSGHTVNYYYFGYIIFAGVTHLSGQAPAVAYNLALATLFAAAVTAAWGMGWNLARLHLARRPALYGAVAALLLMGAGNLEGSLEVYRWHGGGGAGFWSWLSVKHDTDPDTGKWRLLAPISDAGGPEDTLYPTEGWWWWRATRVIDTVVDGESRDYTITEFPFFSFLLGDLHPHVLALPFGLLAAGVCLELLLARPRSFSRWLRVWPAALLPPLLVLGGLGFINGWDLLPYLSLYLATGVLVFLTHPGRRSRRDWRAFGLWAALIPAGAVLLYAPFYLSLAGQLLGPLRGPEFATAQGFPIAWWAGPGTRPVHFLLIWAPFVLAAGSVMMAVATKAVPRLRTVAIGGLATVAVAWLLLELALRGADGAGPVNRIWPLVPFSLSLALAVHVARARGSPGLTFTLGLMAAAFFLFGVSESFHIRDIFGNRMNTIFKLWYQAWIFLAIACAAGLACVTNRPARIAFALAVAIACVYPPSAVLAKTSGFRGVPTLDGLAHLQRSEPAEMEAQQWLAARAPRLGAVVLEATGAQYSRYGRVSSNTGIPTVLGWAAHELQWRGSDRLFRERAGDIDRIYSALNKVEVEGLLERYGVDYVYVGNLERSRYPTDALDAFAGPLGVAFRNEAVTIYRMRPAPN